MRTVSLIKTNVSENGSGFTFRIIDGRVTVIDQEIAISADEVLQAEIESRQGGRGRKPDQAEAALEWLETFLADGRKPAGNHASPVPGSVRYESEHAGHSWRTIERVSVELGVTKRRDAGVSFWLLPEQENNSAKNSSPYTPVNSGGVATYYSESTYESTPPTPPKLRDIGNSGAVDLLSLAEPSTDGGEVSTPPAKKPASTGPKVYDFEEHMKHRKEGRQ